MPEFPLLKSQSGQVEWNGGSMLEVVESYIFYDTGNRSVNRSKIGTRDDIP
jgi:hypothetical protein